MIGAAIQKGHRERVTLFAISGAAAGSLQDGFGKACTSAQVQGTTTEPKPVGRNNYGVFANELTTPTDLQ